MLLKLHIRDFALIDELEIDFKDGLNILTGETGAGKSIIIDAISVIIGDRASGEYIRSGKQSSKVEAVFDLNDKKAENILKEYGIETEDNMIFIDREITDQGRSFCHINGKLVPASALKKVGKHLIDIHGQHQHQSLLDSENHIVILDLLGSKEIQNAKQDFLKIYDEYYSLKSKLQELQKKQNDYDRQKERLKYEIEEIEKADLKPQEDMLLEEEKKVLENAEKIFEVLETIYNILYRGEETPSIIDNLNKIINGFEDIKNCFKPARSSVEFMKNILYELEDFTGTVRSYRDSIEYDPQRLNDIQARLEFLDRLKLKYGMDLSQIMEYKNQAAALLDEVLNVNEEISELEFRLDKVKSRLVENAVNLHSRRAKIATKIESDIARELKDLGMKNVKFSVNFTWQEDVDGLRIDGKNVKIDENGFDRVEFMISTNPGEPLKPLAKIVSGGETSRIMLAIKNIMARVDNIPCLIFDEIDTGIGGRTAQIVGEKLSSVAKNHQVLCVTHSPQIASLGDCHFLIKKETIGGKTCTNVTELKGDERINELARMLGGAQITENTLIHAREMLEMAKKLKAHK